MKMEPIPFPGERVIPPITWRPPAGTRVISADDHYQEPEGLFEDRLPAKYRDRAPKIFRDENGFHMTIDGVSFSSGGIKKSGYSAKEREGAWDMAARLRDMDAELVEKSVVFPQKTMPILGLPDKDYVFVLCDAYNEWMSEVQKESKGRIVPVALLPAVYKVEAAKDYIAKIKEWGFKAMQIPSAPTTVQYNRSAMEPLWQAIAESGIPLSLHVRGHTTTGAGALGADLTYSFQPFRRLLATDWARADEERLHRVLLEARGLAAAARRLADDIESRPTIALDRSPATLDAVVAADPSEWRTWDATVQAYLATEASRAGGPASLGVWRRCSLPAAPGEPRQSLDHLRESLRFPPDQDSPGPFDPRDFHRARREVP